MRTRRSAILRLMTCGVAVCVTAASIPQQVFALAPRSNYEQLSHLKKMAAWELLQALNLNDPLGKGYEILNKQLVSTGETLVKIRVPAPVALDRDPRGLEILYHQLAPTTDFYLLYNEHQHLIAVLPVISKAEHEKKFPGTIRAGWGPVAQYFDFSPYYFEMPKIADPDVVSKWAAFSRQWREDQKILERHLGLMFEEFGNITPVAVEHGKIRSAASGDSNWRPFAYIECPKNADPKEPGTMSDLKIVPFRPDEFNEARFCYQSDKHQFIIPIFPTVYTPHWTDHIDPRLKRANTDSEYYAAIFPGWKIAGFPPQGKGEVIVGGPGCGLDTLLAHLLTGKKIHAIGRNPLEIANTKATARAAGFTVETQVGDLSSPDAIDKAFPGVEFLLAFWNMPLVRSESAVPETFSGYDRIWDQDRGGKILKSFLQWLKRKLPENGMAVAWNGAVGKAYNLLMESMKASGLKRKEFLKGEESDVTQATFGVFFLSQAVESAATVAVKADVDSTRAGETSL